MAALRTSGSVVPTHRAGARCTEGYIHYTHNLPQVLYAKARLTAPSAARASRLPQGELEETKKELEDKEERIKKCACGRRKSESEGGMFL